LLHIQKKSEKHLLDLKKRVSEATDGQVVVNIGLED
jgi:hypothetical protein